MVYKQIPKGYFKSEFPLPHNIKYSLAMSIDDTLALNATYLPILMNDEGLVNADTVNVNPEHGSFAESNNVYCYKNSIIPKINFTLQMKMAKPGIVTDALRTIIMHWMPVYVSFLNRLDAADSKTGVTVENILELEHETTGKSAYPLWGTAKFDGGDVGIHTNATTALMGLTTNDIIENIVFDRELFFDALQYYTNAPMLKKVIGRSHRVILHRDKPYYYHSNNFTSPMVKRINPYTFCGILVYADKATTAAEKNEQMLDSADVTAITHMELYATLRYDEWNSEFDQTSS